MKLYLTDHARKLLHSIKSNKIKKNIFDFFKAVETNRLNNLKGKSRTDTIQGKPYGHYHIEHNKPAKTEPWKSAGKYTGDLLLHYVKYGRTAIKVFDIGKHRDLPIDTSRADGKYSKFKPPE